ncbi:DUF159 domain protein [Metarhizium album ARSEF 1941]|uniref:DUF159 domain protein n=1 Tax=Metarhizium album (strain ARSEF 1941) TaxID=1081103 RepID=A0A0B2WX89_METAS|nr:DUF159 domain protein [Metarhizium album ARSEF 1941]KHN98663.1 DUF159 domain protein [Metarhizium album ARSEF 1941]
MCGRYALALRASQIRQMLQDDGMPVDCAVHDEDGPGAPRQSYNFAPGYHGVVYRAETPDWGAGPRPQSHGGEEQGGDDAAAVGASQVRYKLQSMKWGLVPFWTKRNPDYQTIMRTINCREDSLSTPGGMWASMKSRKRCVVIAQGFFEWLRTGPKDKLPHFVRRRDGRLMCFAGLWDCVQYQGSDEKLYTYTIITTDSNAQLRFLHDRMPVIFSPGSDEVKQWLDPARCEWSRELQSLLRPYDGELQVYPVTKDVGKVGNNSPSFVVPLDSKENKSNIANFFSGAQTGVGKETEPTSAAAAAAVKDEEPAGHAREKRKQPPPPTTGAGRPAKKLASEKAKLSATRNEHRSPKEAREPRSRKITSFFGSASR